MAEYIEGAIEITAASLCTPCLVCGEAVPVFGCREGPKICDMMKGGAKMDGE